MPGLRVYHFATESQWSTDAGNYRPYSSNCFVKSPKEQDGFGFSELPAFLSEIKPDIVLIYTDAYYTALYLKYLNDAIPTKTYQIWSYLDQIYQSQPRGQLQYISQNVDKYFVFNSFWKGRLEAQGVTHPIIVLEHGYSATDHPVIPQARAILGLPSESNIILSVNRNQLRKRLDIVLAATAEVIARHPERDIQLFCLCDDGRKGGHPLREVFAQELAKRKLPATLLDRLTLIPDTTPHTDEQINLYYNAADVGIAVPDAEGFGLSPFEMMGAGKPVVLSDHGAFSSYATPENSRLCPIVYNYYAPAAISAVAGEATACHWLDVANALDELLSDAELRQQVGAAARRTVLEHTWARAATPLLKEINNYMSEHCSNATSKASVGKV